MAFDLQDVRKQILTWIRPIILCFACGIGIGLAIISANGIIHYFQSRPKAWDRKSIRATLVDAAPVEEGYIIEPPKSLHWDDSSGPNASKVLPAVKFDPSTAVGLDDKPIPLNIEGQSSGISFSVDLQNTTDADVTVSKNVIIMQATRGTHTLHDSLLSLEGDYFVPAGHTVSVTLKNSALCATNEEAHQCFDAFFKDDDEIVLFDQAQKYEIHIAIPPIRIPKDQAIYLTGKPGTTAGH